MKRRGGEEEEAHSRRRVDPSRGLVRYVTGRGEGEVGIGEKVGRRARKGAASNFSLPRALRPCDKQIVRRAAKHAEVPFRLGTRHPGPPFRRISYVRETAEKAVEVRVDRWGGRRKRKEEERRSEFDRRRGQTFTKLERKTFAFRRSRLIQ